MSKPADGTALLPNAFRRLWWRGPMIAALSIGVVGLGCEPSIRNPHDHGGGMVDEYRPAWGPVERPAPGTAVYVLWDWRTSPTSRPATRPAARPSRRRAVEVEQVLVHRGQLVGFRRDGGQLLAVAGTDVRPLPAGHYCWHLRPGNPMLRESHDAAVNDAVRTGFGIGLVVVAVAGVIAAVLAIDHNDRHAHLAKTIGEVLIGGDDCGD